MQSAVMRIRKLTRSLTGSVVILIAIRLLFSLHNRLTELPLNLKPLAVESQVAKGQVGCVCAIPSCMEHFASSLGRLNYTERIPRMRHILWKSATVSSYFARQLRTWQAIQPNWTYVLWRDTDLDKFVAKHYTGLLGKFRSLQQKIMQIDLVRYMILHKFGGVYADLDYILLRPLDPFLKFPAVVTRETEAHAFYHMGMSVFPPPVLPSPAFMMSEPGHPFFHYALFQLNCRAAGKDVLQFAGPLGLVQMLKQYAEEFPITEAARGLVIVPPSRNFYAFEGNSLSSSTSTYKGYIVGQLQRLCAGIKASPSGVSANLTAYCQDVTNLDPITNRNELAYAMHDYNKSHSSYDPAGASEFQIGQRPVEISSVLSNLILADSLF